MPYAKHQQGRGKVNYIQQRRSIRWNVGNRMRQEWNICYSRLVIGQVHAQRMVSPHNICDVGHGNAIVSRQENLTFRAQSRKPPYIIHLMVPVFASILFPTQMQCWVRWRHDRHSVSSLVNIKRVAHRCTEIDVQIRDVSNIFACIEIGIVASRALQGPLEVADIIIIIIIIIFI